MKKIQFSDAQRKAALELAKELPHAARIQKLRADLKPLTDTDEESGLVFTAKLSRTLTVAPADGEATA